MPHVLPYFIGVDAASKSLVVAIRGGFSAGCAAHLPLAPCPYLPAGGGAHAIFCSIPAAASLGCARLRACCVAPPVPFYRSGSLSLDDVVRDLLFEPASLDEWLQPGRRWDDPPPLITAASACGKPGGSG